MPVKFSNKSKMRIQETANTLENEAKENINVETSSRNNGGVAFKKRVLSPLSKDSERSIERRGVPPIRHVNNDDFTRSVPIPKSLEDARVAGTTWHSRLLRNEGVNRTGQIQATLKNHNDSAKAYLNQVKRNTSRKRRRNNENNTRHARNKPYQGGSKRRSRRQPSKP